MYTFNELINRMLNAIDDKYDKRIGGVIYTAIAPCAMELANAYVQMLIWEQQSYLLTAIGENLDKRAADFRIERNWATPTKLIAEIMDNTQGSPLPINLNADNIVLGTQFAIPIQGTLGVMFTVTDLLTNSLFEITATIKGNIESAYTGELQPAQIINSFGNARVITRAEEEIHGYIRTAGTNDELDEDFRNRVLDALGKKTFGGNIADYRNFTRIIAGIGDCKVFPVWNGGGTVKISIVDSDFKPTPESTDRVKQLIDPLVNTGNGAGTAPIGHKVTVVTPTPMNVDIKLIGVIGNPINSVIKNSLESYFNQLRAGWGDNALLAINANILTISRSRIIEIVMQPETGISDIQSVQIGNTAIDANMQITDTATTQTIPLLRTVYINGSAI